MFLDIYDLVRIECDSNHNILRVFEAYLVFKLHRLCFNELANADKTTP